MDRKGWVCETSSFSFSFIFQKLKKSNKGRALNEQTILTLKRIYSINLLRRCRSRCYISHGSKSNTKSFKENRNCRIRERRTTIKMGESESSWSKLRTGSSDRCGNCHVRHWCESFNKPQTGKYRKCLRSGKRVVQTVSKQSKRDLR